MTVGVNGTGAGLQLRPEQLSSAVDVYGES